VSPDGSRIAFLKESAVWQMGPNAEEPVRVVTIPPGQALVDLNWSPEGRWLGVLRRVRETGTAVLEVRLPGTTTATTVFEGRDLQGFCWLSAGHLVLNRWEAPNQPTSNLWELDVDPKNMTVMDSPRRLTNWAGFAVGGMSVPKAGGRLAIIKRADQSDVFVGELANHADTLLHPRRLTTDERNDWPGGWSADGRSLLFQSDRTGHTSVFRQRLDATNPESMVTGQDDNRGPSLSPDGQWLVYLAVRNSATPSKRWSLVRIPVGGGSPQTILETNGLTGFVTSGYVLVPTSAGQPAFRCPTQPGASCVLSEATEKEVIFSAFDLKPSAARAEIFRMAVNNPNSVFWDLSPDGLRIAYGERGAVSSLIRVREIGQSAVHDILLPEWPELLTVGWSADGQSLFASNFAPTGSSVLHVSLDGTVRVLYKAAKEVELPKASPDGRHLAFGEVVSTSNVWLIEKLPF
jgi:hypothetical protein